MKSRSWVRFTLGTLVTILFTYFAYRQLDASTLLDRITSFPSLALGTAIIGQILFQALHTLRWGYLLRQLGDVSWTSIYSINTIGNAALYLLPVRLGELVRPTYSTSKTKIEIGKTVSTSVIERVVDGLIVGFFAIISLLSLHNDFSGEYYIQAASIFLAVILSILALMILSVRKINVISNKLDGFLTPIAPKISSFINRILHQFAEATGQLITPGQLMTYVGLSICLWLVDAASVYALVHAYDPMIPFQAALLAISFLAIGSLIPAGPAQIGVFEYSLSIGLLAFGVPLPEGILISTIFHGIVIGLITIMGSSGLIINMLNRP